MRTEAITIVAFAATEKGVGFGRRPFFVVRSTMDLHVKFDGHEIIITRGDGHDDRLSQSARSAKPPPHPKLGRAYRELARDKRVSRPRLSGSGRQGARAVDRVSQKKPGLARSEAGSLLSED